MGRVVPRDYPCLDPAHVEYGSGAAAVGDEACFGARGSAILSPPAPSVEARAEASTLGGRSFSSDYAGRAEGAPTLPKAVAETPGSEQHGARPQQQNADNAPCDPAGNCSAQIPAADLKPLFDYVQDCRACQAQLAAAQKDSADDEEGQVESGGSVVPDDYPCLDAAHSANTPIQFRLS